MATLKQVVTGLKRKKKKKKKKLKTDLNMLKNINKLMYFFGYAPIKISQEVKYYVVPQKIIFEQFKIESELLFCEIDHLSLESVNFIKKRFKQDLQFELFNRIKLSGKGINVLEINDDLSQKIVFKAETYIGKLHDL